MDRPPITIGDVYIGPGATGIVGVNQIGSGNSNPETELKSCIEAFYVTDPRVDRDELINFKGERTGGTCEWIRDDETYKAWLANECSQLLWISGSPGQGKTMLSIFLTDQLERSVSRGTQVLFYFCSYRKEKNSTATTILRTLLHQILKRNPALARHALDRMGTQDQKQDTLGSRDALWQIFLEVLDNPSLGPVVCLLDGLDECKDDSVKWLVTNLRAFFGLSGKEARKTPNALKLVVLSRKIVGLLGFPRLDLESKAQKIESDVHEVVEAKVKGHPKYSETDQVFWAEVISVIRKRCNGTFLWAGLVLNEILGKEMQTEMRQVLREAPEGLNAIYDRILCKIPTRWRKQVARLLQWVAVAAIPLSICQLQEAWGAGGGKDDNEHSYLQDLVTMSGSLLKIDKFEWSDPSKERLSLIHGSVKDYLLCPTVDHDDNVNNSFRVEAETIHFEISKACLISINEIDLKRDWVDLRKQIHHYEAIAKRGLHVTKVYDASHQYCNWISYAVYTWGNHARCCGKAANKLFDSAGPFFHSKAGIRDAWWHFFTHPLQYYDECNIDDGVDKDPSLLHVLSALGITSMVSELLRRMSMDDEDYINHMGDGGYTALYYAVFFGHTDTAQQLLDKGACLSRGYQLKGSGLQAAFKVPHCRLARLLLEHVCHDACMSSMPGQAKVPDSLLQDLLFHAFGAHDIKLVELLYEHGMGTEYPTHIVVMNAVKHASRTVFRFLLNQKLDLDVKDEDTGRTYLQMAAARKDREENAILWLLLSRGAKVNKCGDLGLTALHVAADLRDRGLSNGDLIPILLDYGANVNAVMHDGVRPVDMALMHGSFEDAEILLDASKGAKDTLDLFKNTFFKLHRRMEDDATDTICIDDDRKAPVRFCRKFLRRGPKANDWFWRFTYLDWFRQPLYEFQLYYIQLLMQYGARCLLPENTDRLQKVLQRWRRDQTENWDIRTAERIGDGYNWETGTYYP
ncbi:ankyrin repeat protein [Colletotrichum kahawae]|uniref:Ankyrin repeat protein n=1 Tax=Colletotrichum kahawae TaxID=34407 RepID=A0AAD9YUY8_COLKA|nr:ankyrin repeat protein [Colletotrichum kahawae]